MLGAMTRVRFVAAGPVEEMPYRPWTWAILISTAAVLGLLLGAIGSLMFSRGPYAGQEYHLWRWQADNFSGSLFSLIGIGPDPDDAAGQADLQRYFGITSQIRAALNTDAPNEQFIDTLVSERSAYENDVERVIERYIDQAIGEAGLRESLPLFSAIKMTWPPVDFELTSPPQLLIRSPRREIKRDGDTLLKNDLSLSDIEGIEAKADDDDTVSVVVAIGGIAAYPAIVRDDRTYDSLIQTASHEWVHHYLAFYPLGKTWGSGGNSEPLNETTADLAGRELANLIRKDHKVTFPPNEDGRAPATAAPTIDFNVEMRNLRLQVDALLADGKVDEAEQAMEERRLYFEQNGIYIRKLNQAYFAFYGTYAASPESSNPIGAKIDQVWQLTQNVGAFLRVMREVESVPDLDAAIARLQASQK
ncbi:hypothetical protein AYO38_05090 [bacterium SCGC AG-212-C10]|nr:hypothetical protein AYO38_05090 [bacterium SCGC AG-212-C10]